MDTRAMALKQSHFSVTGVTIDLSHNSQNQKSIVNEKHQSNAVTSAWQALQKHFEEMKDVTIAICSRKIAIGFRQIFRDV